jgi:hypothetical protein
MFQKVIKIIFVAPILKLMNGYKKYFVFGNDFFKSLHINSHTHTYVLNQSFTHQHTHEQWTNIFWTLDSPLFQAFDVFSQHDFETPLEVTLKGYYIRYLWTRTYSLILWFITSHVCFVCQRACHLEKLKKFGKARAFLIAAYYGLVLSTGRFVTDMEKNQKRFLFSFVTPT